MVEILRLRKGPQDLPAHLGVLGFWMGASVVTGILVAASIHGLLASVFLSILDLAILYLFTLSLLGMRGLTYRWLQTYTALVGVSTLLALVMAVLIRLFPPDLINQQIPALGMLFYLIVIVWLLVTFGHILTQSLRLSGRMSGVLIALIFVMVSSFLTQMALSIRAA